MAGRVVKASGTKGLLRIALPLLLLAVSSGFGFTLTGFFMGERGVAKDQPGAVFQEAPEIPAAIEDPDGIADPVGTVNPVATVDANAAGMANAIKSQQVPAESSQEGWLVAQVAQSASSGAVDPIDQMLSTPSPYETKLTDSIPKGRRSPGTRKITSKKQRPALQASTSGKGSPGRGTSGSVSTPANGGQSAAQESNLVGSPRPGETEKAADKKAPEGEKSGDEGTGADESTAPKSGGDIPAGSGKKTQRSAGDDEASKKTNVHLFGTVALFPKPISTKTSPQWYRVMMTQQSPPPIFSNGTAKRMPEAVAKRWFALRKKIENADDLTKIKEVNKFFNTWPYRTDDVVWGVPEYWATPEEFLEKSGDCEDYAITKYYALRSLGFSANQLRIVAVKETIRGIGHAVLAVLHDDTAYILDNLSPYVLEHTVLKNYRPQFSVNENYRWGHARIVKKK